MRREVTITIDGKSKSAVVKSRGEMPKSKQVILSKKEKERSKRGKINAQKYTNGNDV